MTQDKNTNRLIKIIPAVILLAAVIYLSYLLINIIIIVTISFLLAYILKPLVKYLEKVKIPKAWSAFIAVAGTVTALGFLLYFFIPQISSQMMNFLELVRNLKLPEKLSTFEKDLARLIPFLHAKDLSFKIDELIKGTIDSVLQQFSAILGSIISVILVIVFVPFIAFFVLKDGTQLKTGFAEMLPEKYYDSAIAVIEKIDMAIGRFVRGWLLDALFVGLASTLGLYIIGIQNYGMIGLVAGVGHLIPYFGPVIGAVPAILVSLYQYGDFSAVPLIILVFAIVYIIDNGLVQPYVFAKSVNMHPVVIILLIATGGELFGIAGMFLAVPLTNVLRVSIVEIYKTYKSFRNKEKLE